MAVFFYYDFWVGADRSENTIDAGDLSMAWHVIEILGELAS